MKHIDRFISQLNGVVKERKGWKALCPCSKHKDKNPSLSINLSDEDQRILVHCFGGCTKDAILDEMGLQDIDLWPRPGDLDSDGPVGELPKKPSELDPGLCHEAYSALLDRLALSNHHRQNLQNRGLTPEQIDQYGYRSLSFHAFRQAVTALRDEFGDQLLTVPGFVIENGKVVPVQMPKGILIPVRDAEGRIIACQVRSDNGDPKYRWFSGGSTSCGSPAHVPLETTVERKGIRVTEGPLKADIAFALDGIPTMGVAGVSSWKSALPVLESMDIKTVRLAFDADASQKPGVAQALADFASALQDRFEVQIDTWDEKQGKGLDDLLLAGGKPTRLTGADAIDHIHRLLEQQVATPGVDARAAPLAKEELGAPVSEIPSDEALTAECDKQPGAVKGPVIFPYGSGEPEPFPMVFFPEPLQEVVTEISTAINSPPDLAACSMVSAAATAIGRSRQLMPKEDWKIAPRLYMGIVSDPGSGKTPVLTKVMRPLWKKNSEWEKEYVQQQEMYDLQKLTYEAQKKEYIKNVSKRTIQVKNKKTNKHKGEDHDTDAFDTNN